MNHPRKKCSAHYVP